ncbi:MAG: hypothetical protein U0354_14025 [Candidatus Sericytochromatia bacterium]|jgi:hypothetical protein
MFLECQDNQKLKDLYISCGYIELQKDKYVQMYKIFDFETDLI